MITIFGRPVFRHGRLRLAAYDRYRERAVGLGIPWMTFEQWEADNARRRAWLTPE